MNSPDSQSPVEPAEVDDITTKLSALLDGELGRSELIDVEQFAVDNDTTIEELSVTLAASKAAVAELTTDPVSAATRSTHIGAALDAMDAPEVKSMAAARVGRRSDDTARAARVRQLNNRLRRLTAVAAVVVVIGGIGLLSAQGGFGGSDDSDSAAVANDNSADATATLERNQSSDDGAGDDGSSAAELDGIAASAEEAFEDSASLEADETDFAQSGPPAPITVSPTLDLADATLLELPEEILQRSSIAPGSNAPVVEAVCFDEAAQLVPRDNIVEGITVEQDGRELELVVLADEELLVFELPQCVQVD